VLENALQMKRQLLLQMVKATTAESVVTALEVSVDAVLTTESSCGRRSNN
jgi:hypothetical protein